MRFIDLNSAFKMTCELQQHVVNLIFCHKKHLTALEAFVRIKQEDTITNLNEELQCQQQTDNESDGDEQPDHENTVPVNNDELSNNHSQDDQVTCNNTESIDKEATDKMSVDSPVNIADNAITTTNSTGDTNGTSNDNKHRLVSIESLYHDMLLLPDNCANSPTNENAYCNACQLRNQVQNGMIINMVCAACPGFPRICSAQCFRWWHSVHLSAPVGNNTPKSIQQPDVTYNNSMIEKFSRSLSPSEFPQSQRIKEYRAHTRSLPLLSATSELIKSNGRKKKRKNYKFTRIKRHPHQRTSVWMKQSMSNNNNGNNTIDPINTIQRKPGRPRKTQVYINFKDPEWTPYRKY
ncbi:unnamed protein product [Schistosoma turkestanicum]|nr:unnamed protein product [Schistosoma turkestanicum]